MNLNANEWGKFKLSELFDIKKGKRLTTADQIEGTTVFIGAIDSDNGVSNYIGQEPIHDGNTISLSYNGSVGEAFYQPKPFWATDDVNVLYFKESNNYRFNKYLGFFICAILRQEKYKFSYGKKWKLESMNDTVIKLPITPEGVPDWLFMEKFIKSLHHKPITTKNKIDNILNLEVDKWMEFEVGKIFIKEKINKYSAIPDSEGDYEFISSKATNNGVYKKVDETPIRGNCITVSTNGECFNCFYHDKPIVVSSDVEVLYSPSLNRYSAMFICGVLEMEKPKWSYGRKAKNNKVFKTIIKLPVTNKGEPDWEFMEEYIKSLPYGDRL